MTKDTNREIIAFFFLTLTAFVLVCLYSHDSRDFLGGGAEQSNICGPVGAAISQFMIRWLGKVGSYGLTIVLGIWGALVFFRVRVRQWGWKALGTVLVTLCLASLEVAVYSDSGEPHFFPGGYYGSACFKFLFGNVAGFGTFLILGFVILIAFVISTDTTFYPAVSRAGAYVLDVERLEGLALRLRDRARSGSEAATALRRMIPGLRKKDGDGGPAAKKKVKKRKAKKSAASEAKKPAAGEAKKKRTKSAAAETPAAPESDAEPQLEIDEVPAVAEAVTTDDADDEYEYEYVEVDADADAEDEDVEYEYVDDDEAEDADEEAEDEEYEYEYEYVDDDEAEDGEDADEEAEGAEDVEETEDADADASEDTPKVEERPPLTIRLPEPVKAPTGGATPTRPKKSGPYQLAPLSLIEPTPMTVNPSDRDVLERTAAKIEETLQHFKIEARVVEVQKGPTITQFELSLAAGIKVHKIVNLADDLSMALKAQSIRIIAPIPGKSTVGIEVPNKSRNTVGLRELIEHALDREDSVKLPLALGRGTSGAPEIGDLGEMPHLLIAGSTARASRWRSTRSSRRSC